ncbi:MAG: hypothetical protein VKP62_07175 [Candidatus Sericytochromatia bacterium]|nr:hypothetical protein [Candidatus Sericytochromatia bacterium]
MEDGRRPTPKPTWTEQAGTDTPKPQSATRPLSPGELEGMVPAADQIVKSAYGRTGVLPVRPLMSRGDRGTDALVIQKAAKEARVLNFVVDGIHWRAGFAPALSQTPIGRHLHEAQSPPEGLVKQAGGFELRPAPETFERVLRDIIPPPLLQEEERMFGHHRQLLGFRLYYIPQGQAALAGACVWYADTPTGKAHHLYLQTEIKRADPRILDEMNKTFAASAVVVEKKAAAPRAFDFWRELRDAQSEVRASLDESTLARNAEATRQRVSRLKNRTEESLYRNILTGLARLNALGTALFVTLPLWLTARGVKAASGGVIWLVAFVDRALARFGNGGEPPAPPPG